jgi:crooked neck
VNEIYGLWNKCFVFHRARSIYDRALMVDWLNIKLWLTYIEMDDWARRLLNQAVGLLPRENKLWYKYTHMTEKGNIAGWLRRLLLKFR